MALIFNTGGTPIPITDAWREPPRQADAPFQRRQTLSSTFSADGTPGEVLVDLGRDVSKQVRLASSETIGFLTQSEKEALEALYEAGGDFTVSWDRWPWSSPLNETPETKTCYFQPGVTPTFELVNEQADRWFLDIVLRIRSV